MGRGRKRNERKNYSEIKFEDILKVLRDESFIEGFYIAKHNDNLDVFGIDCLIFLKSGLALPIQLKSRSSDRQFLKKVKEHRKKHPLVREVIGIGFDDSSYQICSEVVRRINAAIMRTKPLEQWRLLHCQNYAKQA